MSQESCPILNKVCQDFLDMYYKGFFFGEKRYAALKVFIRLLREAAKKVFLVAGPLRGGGGA